MAALSFARVPRAIRKKVGGLVSDDAHPRELRIRRIEKPAFGIMPRNADAVTVTRRDLS